MADEEEGGRGEKKKEYVASLLVYHCAAYYSLGTPDDTRLLISSVRALMSW